MRAVNASCQRKHNQEINRRDPRRHGQGASSPTLLLAGRADLQATSTRSASILSVAHVRRRCLILYHWWGRARTDSRYPVPTSDDHRTTEQRSRQHAMHTSAGCRVDKTPTGCTLRMWKRVPPRENNDGVLRPPPPPRGFPSRFSIAKGGVSTGIKYINI